MKKLFIISLFSLFFNNSFASDTLYVFYKTNIKKFIIVKSNKDTTNLLLTRNSSNKKKLRFVNNLTIPQITIDNSQCGTTYLEVKDKNCKIYRGIGIEFNNEIENKLKKFKLDNSLIIINIPYCIPQRQPYLYDTISTMRKYSNELYLQAIDSFIFKAIKYYKNDSIIFINAMFSIDSSHRKLYGYKIINLWENKHKEWYTIYSNNLKVLDIIDMIICKNELIISGAISNWYYDSKTDFEFKHAYYHRYYLFYKFDKKINEFKAEKLRDSFGVD
ncbi:MAG: hypothetical protein WCK02_16920 [Bacteroidota bacterium]